MKTADAVQLETLEPLVSAPSRLVEKTPARTHIPFLRWVVRAVEPDLAVRLGVGGGDLYLSLCDSLVALGGERQCHGLVLPSSEGDDGESDFAELSDHHDRAYRHISTLHRGASEDLVKRVEAGTVDLLHIDGRALSEQVEALLAAWRPKLSARAVVLIDGVAMEGGDVRAVQAWGRLAAKNPTAAFSHGGGIGVLLPGTEPVAALRTLIEAGPERRAELEGFFATLGENVVAAYEADDLRDAVRGMQTRLSVQADQHARLLSFSSEAQRIALDQSETITRFVEAETRRQEESRAWRERIEALEHQIAANRNDLHETQAELRRREGECEETQAHLTYAQAELQRLEGELGMIHRSVSWRLTKPLRAARGGLRRMLMRSKLTAREVAFSLPGGRSAYIQLAQASKSVLGEVAPAGQASPKMSLEEAKEHFRAQTRDAFDAFMESGERLDVPAYAHPDVTILLVLYNQAPLTLACLKSLRDKAAVACDTLIVDNASSDETPDLLDRVSGADVIVNAENVGFLKAVNQAAEVAKGKYILLLNNDALLRDGALAAAVEAFEREADVGAVGGRVVLPDGRLQEAGSIIWADGSCLGYGRGMEPEAGEAMFRREVDYCSGVFLLVERETFLGMGGFDERYAPAYYEESDFCMRLREAGKRVLHEPAVVVDHLEFGSSQKSEQALELQRRNRDIFYERHRETLERDHHAPKPENILPARARGAWRGRVLMIDDCVPVPTKGAGFPRACEMVQDLVDLGYEVTHYPLRFPHEPWDEVYAHLPAGVEVMLGRGERGFQAFLEERQGFYDIVLVSRPHNMAEIDRLRRKSPELLQGARVIYDAEAVFAMRDIAKAEVLGSPFSPAAAERMLTKELALCRQASGIMTVSPLEAEHFRAAGYANVHVLGHSLESDPTPTPFEERSGLLFVGRLTEDDSPNTDSLLWFVEQVMPRLRERLDLDVSLAVAGLTEAPKVLALKERGVQMLGKVPSLYRLYDERRVFIAPTRYAGGIPHKVHEAAAHGLPSVVTPLLARQLGWSDGEEILVADTSEAFAEACARLHEDAALWASLRDNALRRIETECSPEQFHATLERIVGGDPL